MLRKIIFYFIVTILLLSCSVTPLGRRQLAFMPADQMNAMGVQAFQQLKQETPISQNAPVNTYVQCISDYLLRSLKEQGQGEWEVVVFDQDTVNAFALPGNKIGVYTGLINVADNQHQLAAVIGHEIAHVLSNHGNERMSQGVVAELGMQTVQAFLGGYVEPQASQLIMGALGAGVQYGVLLPYSRKHESEADTLGLQIMARAGFDPRASVRLWQNMAKQSGGGGPPEFLSTHPSHDTRISDLNSRMTYAMGLYKQAQQQGFRPNCHP